jgi:hypothetical protein
MTMSGTGGDWHESLFKDEKGDSLGDGTWGKPDPNEGKLAPVAWDKLPEAPYPSKKVRARLATPAPGSQKESGLLDIKAIAPSLVAGMRTDEPEPVRPRQPTPSPADVRPARLATPAKGSAGSGLIDVQELVRIQDEKDTAKRESRESTDSIAVAAAEAMNNAAAMRNAATGTGLTASSAQHQPAASDDLDDLDAVPNRGRSMIWVVLVVLTAAVGGLAYYVLTQG